MVTVIVHHTVEDFEKWKAVFDSDLELRKNSGEQSAQVYTDVQDKNKVTIVFEWESAEKIQEFMQSDELKQKMKEGGVTAEPQVHILNKT